jgi:hypothetical protein
MAGAASATVKLHRGLYMQDAISEAAETFADFARFAIEPVGEHYVVAVTEIDGDVEGDVVAEFCNFALANTAVRRKRSNA